MRQVMAMAHARGMQTAMGFEFGVHPPEYFSIMEEGSFWEGTGSMIPNPAHYQSVEILYATIDDIIAAYPDVDHVWLWLNEHSFFGLDPEKALRDPALQGTLRPRRRALCRPRRRCATAGHRRLDSRVSSPCL